MILRSVFINLTTQLLNEMLPAVVLWKYILYWWNKNNDTLQQFCGFW